MAPAEHLRIGRPVAAGSINRSPRSCGARLATPNFREFDDCRGHGRRGASMTPAATRPYLRYAVTETLHAEWLRRIVLGWPFLASSAAVQLVAGPNAPMTCTIIPTTSSRAGLRAGRARMMGRSSSPTNGRSKFRLATPSCARSKATCGKSWTSCLDRCRDVRSEAS